MRKILANNSYSIFGIIKLCYIFVTINRNRKELPRYYGIARLLIYHDIYIHIINFIIKSSDWLLLYSSVEHTCGTRPGGIQHCGIKNAYLIMVNAIQTKHWPISLLRL